MVEERFEDELFGRSLSISVTCYRVSRLLRLHLSHYFTVKVKEKRGLRLQHTHILIEPLAIRNATRNARPQAARSKSLRPIAFHYINSQKPQEPEPSETPDGSPAASPEPATQRRRSTPPSEPDEEADEPYGGAPNTQHSDQSIKKLIRLALAHEYQRKPLRRTDITEKVLGKDNSRSFKPVFAAAQAHLRNVFGMELTELPAREKITLRQKRQAQKSQSQASKAPQSWILTTILPAAYKNDPAILPPMKAPTVEVDATYTSIYTILISFIMLSGGQIPQAKMERYLRRLGMEDKTPVPGSEKTEKLLKRLEKDGYIREIREKATAGEEDVSYIVGPRGKVEVGDRGVEGLVKAVYGELDGEGEEELGRRIARSLGMNEQPKATQNGTGKKRGRPRRDEQEEQGGGASGSDSSSEDEEGAELYE